jgi:hypothetical protein
MRSIAVTIALGMALALGACGGSSKDNASNTTSTTPTTATQPAAGATGRSGKHSGKQAASGKNKGQSKKSGGAKTQTTKTQTQTQTTKTSTTTTPSSSPPSVYKTAKNICGTIIPNVVQRQLRQGKTTKKKVAKQYSTGWPPEKRKDAYKGCLAGLKKFR